MNRVMNYLTWHERDQMNDAGRFYSKDEWARVKYPGQETPKYYESWLHYEGLKCVTNGIRYYLDTAFASAPTPTPVEASVPVLTTRIAAVSSEELLTSHKNLPELIPGAEVRVVSITSEMNPGEAREFQCCILAERTMSVVPGMRYGDLLLTWDFERGEVNTNRLDVREQRVVIYWYGVPHHQPHPSNDLASQQQEIAYPIPKYHEEVERQPDNQKVSRGIEWLDLSLADGLKHFHLDTLSPERQNILKFRHSFLLVGDFVFFITNLQEAFAHLSGEGIVDFEADTFSVKDWVD